tara:strand:- start:49 stop:369 length:321 start_codon:yes stop_codon:yes gene_type:complete
MKTRVLKILTNEDISMVANIVQSWRKGEQYEDVVGFCKSTITDDIMKSGFVLTPGRYVGFADEEDDRELFTKKIQKLTIELRELQSQSNELDINISINLKKIINES